MSRTKKSRKPSAATITLTKEEKSKLATPTNKKPKKKTGKVSGNRQQEGRKTANSANNAVAKDPRIGSKKPIVLSAAPSAKQPAKKAKPSPIAAVRAVEPENDYAAEIAAIENDELLQVILEKQETEQALSAEEVNYFNDKMERHQELSLMLGLNDDDSTKQDDEHGSEDDLWDKLDNTDFSDYQ